MWSNKTLADVILAMLFLPESSRNLGLCDVNREECPSLLGLCLLNISSVVWWLSGFVGKKELAPFLILPFMFCMTLGKCLRIFFPSTSQSVKWAQYYVDFHEEC